MTAIHCPFCPFAGCIWCDHKGGTDGTKMPEPQANRDAEVPENDARNGRVGGSKTAPGGASTPLVQGPRPSDEEGLPPMVATRKTPRHASHENGSVR